MKTVDHRSEEQLLVAAYQQTTQNLTRRYPTIACEDIQDAVSQATADLLSAGGVSALLDKKCLYQYILVSAERNIWHLQKRDAVMVRLESIDNFESSAWIADDVRTDDRAAQHILRSAIEKQIGEENAAIVWQYVMDGDKPQEIAKGFAFASYRKAKHEYVC